MDEQAFDLAPPPVRPASSAPPSTPAARAPTAPAAPAAMAVRARPSLATLVSWGLAAFALLACLTMLTWPLGYDQGVFASNGDIVARGGAPYVDAWDVKGPLVFYMQAAIQRLFGRHAWGLRVVDIGFALLTSLMLWRRLRVVTTPAVAFAAAAVWPAFVAGLGHEASAQYELWIGTAMLGITLLMTRPGGYRARDLLVSGALVGLATLTKPIFPVFLAVPGIAVLLRHTGARGRLAFGPVARDLAVLVSGCVVPVIAGVAALWAQGALREAWNVHILYNLHVYAPNPQFSRYPNASPMQTRVIGLAEYLGQAKVALVIPPAVAGAVALWRRQRTFALVVVTWLVTGVALVLLQNKFWLYHWETVYPAVLLLVAVGLHALVQNARATRHGTVAAVAYTTAALAFALWTFMAFLDVRLWALYALGRKSEAAYYGHFTREGEINPADERTAGAYLRAHTPPGTPFANWTLHAGLPFTAGRPDAMRIHNKRELTKLRTSAITQGYRREYLERVRALRPTYIAVDSLGDSASVFESTDDALAREFPEFAALVARDYRQETRFGEIVLYRRRADADVGRPVPAATTSSPR